MGVVGPGASSPSTHQAVWINPPKKISGIYILYLSHMCIHNIRVFSRVFDASFWGFFGFMAKQIAPSHQVGSCLTPFLFWFSTHKHQKGMLGPTMCAKSIEFFARMAVFRSRRKSRRRCPKRPSKSRDWFSVLEILWSVCICKNLKDKTNVVQLYVYHRGKLSWNYILMIASVTVSVYIIQCLDIQRGAYYSIISFFQDNLFYLLQLTWRWLSG